MRRKVADWLYEHRWVPWWVTAFVLSAAFFPDYYNAARFYLRPVVEMQGELVLRGDNSARVHIFGKKLRGVECKYIGIQAFGDRLVGLPVDLTLNRVDMPSEGLTKPQGTFDIGVWEVRPTFGVTGVRVYTTHECDDYRVGTKIAEVKL